jgi:hypothetical protein
MCIFNVSSSKYQVSRPPISEIEKIVADGTIADFGNRRHHALELEATDAGNNLSSGM